MSNGMRISLVLAREDNPRLYDELVQFPKGPRRVNRLRMLAYDGLLAQGAPVAQPAPHTFEEGHRASESGMSEDRAKASLELFSEPLSE
ncbi:hypothetical protein RugamoR57_48790 [Duganella caerulea]|uniref:hypothetical protein n=1 Tax=Duganella caerulea TaxID=2885762 RepID=UPI0030EA3AC9